VIAVDSSVVIAWLNGEDGPEVPVLDLALGSAAVVLPPVVVAEVLSAPELPEAAAAAIAGLPRIPVDPGMWERAGRLRARFKAGGSRARLADTLIAQLCIDADVPLLTRGADFARFVAHGLRLVSV